MNEAQRKARLNEIGKEIAGMYPDSHGSVTFDYGRGDLKGVRQDSKWRPKGSSPGQVL